jgi:MATE family multidrug resistance protein
MPPYWLLLWHVGDLMRRSAVAELAARARPFSRAYMWCTAPWLLFQLLQELHVGARAAARRAVAEPVGIALNSLLSWSLIFGRFGLPALGLVGGGLGSTLTWLIIAAR